MADFKKNNFVTGCKEQQNFEERQSRLRQKNDIEDDSVVVVEKSNMAKFTVKTFAAVIRLVSLVILLVLASVGVICLIDPSTRLLFFSIFNGTIGELKGLLGM